MKTHVKNLLENLLGCTIVKNFPHGYNAFNDMKKRLAEESFDVVFDVGANDGRSAVKFIKEFPNANIYCFEPVKSTFQELETNMASTKQVKSFNFALGSSEGTASVEKDPTNNSRCNRLKVDSDTANDDETVTVKTLDNFCKNHAVSKIDFLKIDTEGFDLEVLKGSENYLREQKISFLQVEASMNPHNLKHIKFEEFKSFLESRGYVLFGIYDQTPEWSGEPRLRFSNPMFIAENLV